MKWNELAIYVADDDFIEYLYEQGHLGTIDIDELFIEWEDWSTENVASKCNCLCSSCASDECCQLNVVDTLKFVNGCKCNDV